MDVVSALYTALYSAQKVDPNIVIIMETPQGTVRCKIGDALIYMGMRNEIVIDSE